MTAYIVLMKETTHDPAELEIYAQGAKAARGDHPITPLAFYGDLEVLEGPAMEGAVILQFPDVESARAWYYSPAYQEAMQHRVKGADWRAFIVKGVA
ncbi:DUF1330 domain-containing protein [Alloalcanivorax xenomutans]|jgi:uncharacterized protein (DUF1330 family)|uniref:DUF1330 domain-containing protein n=2 Tax=Alloalcanivorax xenomutans TaxID=1094342 RepID=A0A9Q3W5S9_9GAMM|nr:DUF1330 domain-containing protein [Alloalcanivorax xenomutans]ERS13059.1 hypothetical protein Q668_01910 [Alcanivorax sp. PN-3]KYZ88054.1 hypothetical protein A3Q32_01180 [Alcanivorax sp. KX64203]MBA4720204.1 DUF1330 domain-containing protein [Alcanivorax sp.]ARB45776.1 hypothetical protein P40_10450 [Alloalcanivorax xenomutans]MCE7509211.1 DUF1330 domain-containing protein [Alloalcanivorax xenomutans]